MTRKHSLLAAIALLSVSSLAQQPAAPSIHGIDASRMDTSIQPGDDFYHYANGTWIAHTEIHEHPIFVIGHWSSGTTLLHELLVCDPRHTYPDTYACLAPNHFLLTRRVMTVLLS